MPTKCFAPLLGKRIRVTRLNECGAYPAPGTTDSVIATDGFISVSLSSEIEEGTEIITKKASGALCVNEKLADSFKRFTVEIEFCGVNPSLFSMVTNADPYQDYAGDDAGFVIGEGEIDSFFALELWTGISGLACEPGVEEASGYLLLPFLVGGVLGDLEINSDDAISFTVSGAYTKGGNAWGVGPYDVLRDESTPPGVDAPLPTALDPLDHLLLIDTGVAPPPSSCDPGPMPASGGTVATGATAGTPGSFTPGGSSIPANLAAMSTVTANPTTAWTTGQHVVLGDSSHAYWDGSAWVTGDAP